MKLTQYLNGNSKRHIRIGKVSSPKPIHAFCAMVFDENGERHTTSDFLTAQGGQTAEEAFAKLTSLQVTVWRVLKSHHQEALYINENLVEHGEHLNWPKLMASHDTPGRIEVFQMQSGLLRQYLKDDLPFSLIPAEQLKALKEPTET